MGETDGKKGKRGPSPEKLQSLASFYARQMVEQHDHSISRIRQVMSTSVILERRPRESCQWKHFGGTQPCPREARYQVVCFQEGIPGKPIAVCYRHRWVMRDYVQELQRHPGPPVS